MNNKKKARKHNTTDTVSESPSHSKSISRYFKSSFGLDNNKNNKKKSSKNNNSKNIDMNENGRRVKEKGNIKKSKSKRKSHVWEIKGFGKSLQTRVTTAFGITQKDKTTNNGNENGLCRFYLSVI